MYPQHSSVTGDQTADIAQGAHIIRLHLPDLLDLASASTVDLTLTGLLALNRAGRSIDGLVMSVLEEYEPTRIWMQQYLQDPRFIFHQPRHTLQGVRLLRSYLPEMLGEETAPLDQTLAGLLALAATGRDVEGLLKEALASSEEADRWMDLYLGGSLSMLPYNFSETPGKRTHIILPTAPTICTCPQCDFVWVARSAGEQLPAGCGTPNHGALNCS